MALPPLVLSWERVEALVERLALALAPVHRATGFERIVAVARGGLAPAALLAARLEVAHVESVQVRAYDDRAARAAPVLAGPAPAPVGVSGDPARTLVVDELIESGGTLALLERLLPGAPRAVLLVKGELALGSSRAPGCVHVAALAARGLGTAIWAAEHVASDRWVLFPWSPASERAGGL